MFYMMISMTVLTIYVVNRINNFKSIELVSQTLGNADSKVAS